MKLTNPEIRQKAIGELLKLRNTSFVIKKAIITYTLLEYQIPIRDKLELFEELYILKNTKYYPAERAAKDGLELLLHSVANEDKPRFIEALRAKFDVKDLFTAECLLIIGYPDMLVLWNCACQHLTQETPWYDVCRAISLLENLMDNISPQDCFTLSIWLFQNIILTRLGETSPAMSAFTFIEEAVRKNKINISDIRELLAQSLINKDVRTPIIKFLVRNNILNVDIVSCLLQSAHDPRSGWANKQVNIDNTLDAIQHLPNAFVKDEVVENTF